LKVWSEVQEAYRALGLVVDGALAVFRYGGGWSKLRTAEQIAAKEKLVQALDGASSTTTASLFRAFVTQQLVTRYYARAGRSAPTMRQALTKSLHRALSGFFFGDWLGFLRYLDEQPHPDERISTSLPEAKLYVTADDRVAKVAAKHQISPAEVERMLGAFWGSERGVSPVQRRVDVFRRYWRHFDAIHARQAPGMKSLWGFVDESTAIRLNDADGEQEGPAWYFPGSYRRLLPAELLAEIEYLWGGTFLPSRPDRVVTNPSPHALMAQALGPALRFWHGAALTAWFVAEGPFSRTDMAGLAKYHASDLAELAELGCPVDPKIFADLIASERKLGPPTPITDPGSQTKHNTGALTFAISVTIGSRRGGFELLRDVLTKHRRNWTESHLEAYLRARWETELRSAAREFNRLCELKGKPPTARAFARVAESPTNHWFGGDVGAFYAAFGEKSPVQAARVRLLPHDIQTFMWRVFEALGGRRTSWHALATTIVGSDREKQDAEWREHGNRKRLAELSIWYVQLREALDNPPSLKDFGVSTFEQVALLLAEDIAQAWALYSRVVDEALAVTGLMPAKR
jgi:hypothetical protein